MRNLEEITDEVFQRRDEFETSRKEQKQSMRRKMISLVAVLTIVLAVGVVGVAAAAISGADWFANFYTKTSDGELTDSQLKYLADKTIDIQQSVTSDGITMTLGAVNYSRDHLDVYIQVVAPEGVSLEAVNLGSEQNPDSFVLEKDGNLIPCDGIAYEIVPDEDESDNKKTYFFTFDARDVDGEEYIFSENGQVTLVIDGLYYGAFFEDVISEGKWSFEINFVQKDEKGVEILTEPIVCDTFDWMTRKYTGVVQINSFTMYAMVGKGTFDVVERIADDVFTSINVKVILKDGSTATVTESGYRYSEDDYKNCTIEAGFGEPIMLSEIDYVVFGGYKDENGNWVEGTRVDVP